MSRPAPPPVNAELQTRAVGLINEAKMSTDRVSILETLKQVLELALHRKGGRALLPLLVSTLTEFQVHTIAAVRVFVLHSIEKLAKHESTYFVELFDAVHFRLLDKDAGVVRAALLQALRYFRRCMGMLDSAARAAGFVPFSVGGLDSRMLRLHETLKSIKTRVFSFVAAGADPDAHARKLCLGRTRMGDSHRTVALKFLEMLVLLYSAPDKDAGSEASVGVGRGAVAPMGAASPIHFNLLDVHKHCADAAAAAARYEQKQGAGGTGKAESTERPRPLWDASALEMEGRQLLLALGELMCDSGGTHTPFLTSHYVGAIHTLALVGTHRPALRPVVFEMSGLLELHRRSPGSGPGASADGSRAYKAWVRAQCTLKAVLLKLLRLTDCVPWAPHVVTVLEEMGASRQASLAHEQVKRSAAFAQLLRDRHAAATGSDASAVSASQEPPPPPYPPSGNTVDISSLAAWARGASHEKIIDLVMANFAHLPPPPPPCAKYGNTTGGPGPLLSLLAEGDIAPSKLGLSEHAHASRARHERGGLGVTAAVEAAAAASESAAAGRSRRRFAAQTTLPWDPPAKCVSRALGVFERLISADEFRGEWARAKKAEAKRRKKEEERHAKREAERRAKLLVGGEGASAEDEAMKEEGEMSDEGEEASLAAAMTAEQEEGSQRRLVAMSDSTLLLRRKLLARLACNRVVLPTPALDEPSVAAVADGGSEGTDGEKSGYSDADVDAFLERALPPPISRLVSHIAADFERRAALAQAVLVQEWAVVARAAAARALATQLRAALPASPPRPVKQEASLEDSGAEDSGVSEPASKRMAMTIPSFEDAVEVEVDDDYDEEDEEDADGNADGNGAEGSEIITGCGGSARAPSRYDALLLLLLRRLGRRLRDQPQHHPLLRRLLLRAPALSAGALAFVFELCVHPTTYALGLEVLSDLVLQRRLYTDAGLTAVLMLTHHADDTVRSPAIRLVAQRFYAKWQQQQAEDGGSVGVTNALCERIERHAMRMLRCVVTEAGGKAAQLNDVDVGLRWKWTDATSAEGVVKSPPPSSPARDGDTLVQHLGRASSSVSADAARKAQIISAWLSTNAAKEAGLDDDVSGDHSGVSNDPQILDAVANLNTVATKRGLRSLCMRAKGVKLVQSRLDLYIAMVTKRPSMLAGLLHAYALLSEAPDAQLAMRNSICMPGEHRSLVLWLGRRLGAAEAVRLAVSLAPTDGGADDLLLQMLQTMFPPPADDANEDATEPEKRAAKAAADVGISITPAVIQAVSELCTARDGNVRFLVPIVQALPAERFLSDSLLPKLISLPVLDQRAVFRRIELGRARLHRTEPGPPAPPIDVLVALHRLSPREHGCSQAAVMRATELCLNKPRVYDSAAILEALRQIAAIRPLPWLLMRTVIQSVLAWPDLKRYIMGPSVMGRLVEAQVWSDSILWTGVLKCVSMTKQLAFPFVMDLPPAQIADVLSRIPDMKPALREHAAVPQRRRHLQQAVLDLLDLEVLEPTETTVVKGAADATEVATAPPADAKAAQSELAAPSEAEVVADVGAEAGSQAEDETGAEVADKSEAQPELETLGDKGVAQPQAQASQPLEAEQTETLAMAEVKKMKVAELKAELKKRDLSTDGLKAVLLKRLQEAIA